MSERKIKVLIGKVGCDIHERGALTMLNVFKDAGFEVIYTGRYQSEEGVVNAAINEDVDVIAISDLTGSLPIIMRKITNELKENNAENIKTICGGILTQEDIEEITAMGVDACFQTGAPFQASVIKIKELLGVEK